MSKQTGRTRCTASGASLLALCIASALHAQEARQQPTDLDSIVVTGTNIRGAEPAGNTVQVIGADQIKASGKSTIADFLRDLPANFAGGVGLGDNVQGGQDASAAGANMTGGQGVNLRGLGALSTLVLVDGRRVAAAGQFGDFVDISNIPLAAIDRIEVLADGASAVYGSDAVGGVVNIILKRDADGFDTSVRVGTSTQGGGQQFQLSQTWGGAWDTGHAFMGVEFNRQGRVSASDRAIYNGGDFSNRGGVDWPFYTSRAGAAANLFSGTPSGIGNVIYSVPGGSGEGLQTSDLVQVSDGAGNTSNPWEQVDILPEMKRTSVFAAFDQQVGDSATLYGDTRYTHRIGEYRQGYAVLYGALPATSPYYIDGASNNFGVVIDDFPLTRKVSDKAFAGNLGLRFDFADDWHGDATVSYSREEQNRRSYTLRNANIYDYVSNGAVQVQAPSSISCALMGPTPAGATTAAQAYCAALDYAGFNPYTTDALSDQVLGELIGYEDVTFTSWLAQASFKVDGTLAHLPGGDLRLAAGLDWRRENIGGDLDFNWRSTDPVQVAYGATERDVAAGFVEAAIPLIGKDNALPWAKALDLSLALRHERYSGLGRYDTTNPKVGVSFKPTDDLTLRGSWGSSFHAPPMRYMYDGVQPVNGGNASFLRSDLYTAPCNTTLVPLNGVSGIPGGSGNCSFTAIVVTGGAGTSLKPEEAKTWTAGFDYTPDWAPGLKLGASYFNIKIDDRIVRIQAGTLPSILSNYFATGSSPYLGNLSVNPSLEEVNAMLSDPRYLGQVGAGPVQSADDVAMIVYATQMNLAKLKMDGFDFNASYGFDVGAVDAVDLFLRGTRLLSYGVQSSPGEKYVNQLGEYSSVGNPVKLRSQQGVTWTHGGFRGTLSANYVHDYQCSSGCYVPSSTGSPVLAVSPVKIGSWTTFDLQLDYDLDRFGGLFRGMQASFYANNLFGKDPPFIDGGTAASDALADPYDAANATVLGRTLALTINKHW